eukprot:8924236-Ditylum_brightwellii.AAC.1
MAINMASITLASPHSKQIKKMRDQKRWKRRNGIGDSTMRKRWHLYVFDAIGRWRIQCNRI